MWHYTALVVFEQYVKNKPQQQAQETVKPREEPSVPWTEVPTTPARVQNNAQEMDNHGRGPGAAFVGLTGVSCLNQSWNWSGANSSK